MRATRLTQFEVVVEYVISAIKYLNSHDQLPVDLMAQSVRALSRSSDQLQRSWVQIPPRSQQTQFPRQVGFEGLISHWLTWRGGRTYVRTVGRTEVTS